ncbi:MAG: hypothetical protein J6V32_05230 [Elusimicrobiaceae bacterium]|nr:hypothetical protein [Elusimicrobiaceae bacterium]
MNVARLVHPGFWFDKTPMQQALDLAKRGVGGFCLYGGTKEQVAEFTAAVRAASPLDYLLISADYEDGLGRWLPDAPLLPSNMALGAANDENLAFEKGLITARQARSLGVDWVFAPVLDLANNPLNPIVNTRSFGAAPERVIRLGRAFLKGLAQDGALSSIKHFPGHGDTTTDSHVALPVLQRTQEELLTRELIPFQQLLPFADSVMLGHLLLPEIDPENPASLSPAIAGEMLRKQLNYQGCVLTDALLMKAIGDEKQAALRALQTGVNILLVPQNPGELIDFLEENEVAANCLALSEKLQNTLCAKAKNAGPRPTPQEAFAPNDFTRRTAQKAIVFCGQAPSLKAGQTVHYLEIGSDGKTSATPLYDALKKAGVCLSPFTGKADYLLVVCLRRYKAFRGSVALEQEDESRLQTALQHCRTSVAVLLASPWALPAKTHTHGTLFTFSPAPEFQETAAEILLGSRPAKGQLPISL